MSIYRCMIVDDEDLIIRSLEQFFQPHADRYVLVGKAYSGKEGVELALQLKPDIILTDIVMPGMDGIAMIETLKAQLPATVFIILTAYSDFDYAKQAIRMNVKDYIVKVPLSEHDIFQAMDRAAETICELRIKDAELRKLNTSRLENIHRFRRQIFNELFQGELQPSQLHRYSDDLNIKPDLEGYSCFVMVFNDYQGFKRQYSQADQGIIRYGMLNIAEETIKMKAQGFVVEMKDNQLLGVVKISSKLHASQLDLQCMELGQELIANIQKFMKQTVNVGVSGFFEGWSTLQKAYSDATAMLRDVYYYGGEGYVFTAAQHLANKPGNEIQVREWFNEILLKLTPEAKLEDFQGAFRRISSFAFNGRIPKEIMTLLMDEFLDNVKRTVQVWKVAIPQTATQHVESMKFNEQWEAMKLYIETCLLQRHASAKPEITKAKQYIEKHIAERLTLDDVAEYVNLAPHYFSTLFKKVENENFIDYVNRRKIEKAVALLKEKDYSNLQLSSLVGIQNERYFCTLFKHYFGLPPQKFRKTFL
ncbi:hypothetical protein A8709_13460 [Paenibacillus pectinilyticus]|uniref:DNA-binding response regulator n=1 Tax=Paenibacillus pectinilyticus TaxID=512399 RepID=A0A1C1A3H6_9BACL|nr:response regulator [Paenibacillus pectinilyticus]OCT15112.1 hypothetical protein A8709_13460 [Paenibacillus pectinilyticus]